MCVFIGGWFLLRQQGAPFPITATPGWFTVSTSGSKDVLHQDQQLLCPAGSFCVSGVRSVCSAGTFGNVSGLSATICSGSCQAGYYCVDNSTTATQFQCGNASVYCPTGSAWPTVASVGQLTVNGNGVGVIWGVSPPGGDGTMMSALPCPSGSYCTDGVALPCPAGRFGCALVGRICVPSAHLARAWCEVVSCAACCRACRMTTATVCVRPGTTVQPARCPTCSVHVATALATR